MATTTVPHKTQQTATTGEVKSVKSKRAPPQITEHQWTLIDNAKATFLFHWKPCKKDYAYWVALVKAFRLALQNIRVRTMKQALEPWQCDAVVQLFQIVVEPHKWKRYDDDAFTQCKTAQDYWDKLLYFYCLDTRAFANAWYDVMKGVDFSSDTATHEERYEIWTFLGECFGLAQNVIQYLPVVDRTMTVRMYEMLICNWCRVHRKPTKDELIETLKDAELHKWAVEFEKGEAQKRQLFETALMNGQKSQQV